MKKQLLIALIVSTPSVWAEVPDGLFEFTMAARECTVDTLDKLSCDYDIGNDLSFTISNIGEPEGSSLHFNRLTRQGDYYADVDSKRNCITIRAGSAVDHETLRDWVLTGKAKAFVSMTSGKVYDNFSECVQGF